MESRELVVWLVKFAWISACVKARLPNDPDYVHGIANMQTLQKRMEIAY